MQNSLLAEVPFTGVPFDSWNGLSRDAIERFVDVTGFTRKVSRVALRGYRADLYALESWMQGTTGHTVMTASTAELWAYFRKAIAAGTEPRLLDRLLVSMRLFYAYVREAGYRDDDPATRVPQWVHNHPAPVHAHG